MRSLRGRAYGPADRQLVFLEQLRKWRVLPRCVVSQGYLYALPPRFSSSEFGKYLVDESVRRYGMGPLSLFVLFSCLQFLRSGSAFCRFYFWLSNERNAALPRVSLGVSKVLLLPTHLPRCHLANAPPKSRRGRAEFFAQHAAWQLVEWSLALFSFYECRNPKSPSKILSRLRRWQVSAEQDQAARELFEGTVPFCRLRVTEPLARGRKALAVALARLSGPSLGQPCPAKIVGAKSVNIDRVKIPDVAGLCDPSEVLQGRRLRQYMNYESLWLDPRLWKYPLPKPCLMISPADERRLRPLLVRSGMAVLVEDNDVLRTPAGRKVLSGLFCVEHKAASDRIIFDRRPQNRTEERLNWANLPHGTLLCRILLRDHQHIRGTVRDLSNYFYNLRGPPGGPPRNAFCRIFTGPEAAALGGDPSRKYHLGLAVWAMGDQNSVCVSQAVHEDVLRQHGGLRPHQILAYRSPMPLGPTMQGVYVDDLLIVSVVSKEDLCVASAAEDTDLLAPGACFEPGAPQSLPSGTQSSPSSFAARVTLGTVCTRAGNTDVLSHSVVMTLSRASHLFGWSWMVSPQGPPRHPT